MIGKRDPSILKDFRDKVKQEYMNCRPAGNPGLDDRKDALADVIIMIDDMLHNETILGGISEKDIQEGEKQAANGQLTDLEKLRVELNMLGCINHAGDPDSGCLNCFDYLLDDARAFREENDDLVKQLNTALKERDSLVSEYERAVKCGPLGFTHAAVHIYNAITNAKCDVNADRFLELIDKIEKETEGKRAAYKERNQLVAALSKLFPSYLCRHPEDDKEWDEDWKWIVIVNLPTGQCSWHIHDSEVAWFDHLDRKDNDWDGHTTKQKYERVARL